MHDVREIADFELTAVRKDFSVQIRALAYFYKNNLGDSAEAFIVFFGSSFSSQEKVVLLQSGPRRLVFLVVKLDFIEGRFWKENLYI